MKRVSFLKKAQKGFTLIELVITIVIIGILAAVAIPKFVSLTGDANKSVVDGVAGALASAASVNYAKSASGATTGFVTVTACDNATAASLLTDALPTGVTIGTGSGTAGTTAGSTISCTATKAGQVTTFTMVRT